MLSQSEAAELASLMRKKARRAPPGEPLDIRLGRIRERLVAAFGEADMAAALAIDLDAQDG